MSAPKLPPFEPTAALEKGVTLFEASAGTGKTWSLAAVALKLVVEEGVEISELVVVTFTRAATAELRSRVRDRLVGAAAALVSDSEPEEPLLASLWNVSPQDREVRVRRLRAAIESFDECLISTIHGFCQRMLVQHAFDSGADFGLELAGEFDAAKEEACTDIFLRELYDADLNREEFLTKDCHLTLPELKDLASTAVRDPDLPLDPPPPPASLAKLSAAQLRSKWAQEIRETLEAHGRRTRTQTFQDLLRGLARRLGPEASAAARAALIEAIRGRFRAALIDEFQDTDPHQWRIFSALFGTPDRYLFLVGDPKQAIYGFRGANLNVYFAAAEKADRASTLLTNYRSDQAYLEAIAALFSHAQFFGELESGGFQPVAAAEPDPPARVTCKGNTDAVCWEPLQLRFFDGEHQRGRRWAQAGRWTVERPLATLVADDIVRLLSSELSLPAPEKEAPEDAPPVRIGPRDVAVLVRSHKQAHAVEAALRKAKVPAVITGAVSVYHSEAAEDLLAWLEALSQPRSDGPARRAAVTRTFGWTGTSLQELDAEDPAALAEWHTWLVSLAEAREAFAKRGLARAFRLQLDAMQVTERLLGAAGGERHVTDLDHVVELLARVAAEERLGLSGLVAHLLRERGRRSRDVEGDARRLRLDRDDDAVRILTMHVAKGLEFPFVFAPFLWTGAFISKGDTLNTIAPRADDPTDRVLDLHVEEKEPPKQARLAKVWIENSVELRRLLYVAMTRAKHCTVLYTGHVDDLPISPLALALHSGNTEPDEDEHVPWPSHFGSAGRSDAELADARVGVWRFRELERLAQELSHEHGGARIRVERCPEAEWLKWTGAPSSPEELSVRPFTRAALERQWGRTSFTALSRGSKRHEEDEEPEREGVDHDADAASSDGELPGEELAEEEEKGLDGPDVPLARFPAGAAQGSALHAVFEHLDFAALHPDVDAAEGTAALEKVLDEQLPRFGFSAAAHTSVLVPGLRHTLRTPLGGPLGDLRLCDLQRRDRLDEMAFDLPIAGGRAHGQGQFVGHLQIAALAAACIRAPGQPPLPPGASEDLARLSADPVAGFLTGSIDLIFRAPVEGRDRWFLADYKSNRLDPHRTGRSPVAHYSPARMKREMVAHHYVLQYHLYALALHRWLRWRLGDAYDPHRDLGGSYYLFLRGMTGDKTPRQDEQVHGVYFDAVPVDVLERLDALFTLPAVLGASS
jgi:exodeoxyribonuclease V beta subunit